MANTSATGGFLVPTSSPLEGQALLDFIQPWLVGITNYPQTSVRPRWQVEPANLPAASVDWMSFGIMNRDVDTFPYEALNSSGTTTYYRHERLNLLLSFYGPNAYTYATMMRDVMFLPQNLEYLYPQSMSVISAGRMVTVPELIKFQWLNHVDLPIAMRRKLIYNYEILDLLSATGTITVDNGGSPNGIATVPVLTIKT